MSTGGPVPRLLIARAAVLDASRAVRLSAQEPNADVDRCLEMAARLDSIGDELHGIEQQLSWEHGHGH